ncbi:hypothetical protein HK104_007391, partial [Borealophlyctis nickersoniae]
MLTPAQCIQLINYATNAIVNQRVTEALAAERTAQAAAQNAAIRAAIDAAVAATAATITPKQLVTYDGKRDIKAYNQFFQQLDQLFGCQHIEDKNKILIALPIFVTPRILE